MIVERKLLLSQYLQICRIILLKSLTNQNINYIYIFDCYRIGLFIEIALFLK